MPYASRTSTETRSRARYSRVANLGGEISAPLFGKRRLNNAVPKVLRVVSPMFKGLSLYKIPQSCVDASIIHLHQYAALITAQDASIHIIASNNDAAQGGRLCAVRAAYAQGPA